MPQTYETVTTQLSGPVRQPVPVPVRPVRIANVAVQARADVDRLVALNANLLAAA